MSLLSLSHVVKRFAADLILDDVSLQLQRGEHVALVGSNGAGKSTLLRIVAGLEEPDAGAVHRARGLRLAYLPQEPDFGGSQTVYEAMLDVFRAALEAQEQLSLLSQCMADTPGDPAVEEEYGRLHAVVEHTGYDYRERIERVLAGLGLGRETWHAPIAKLSGGQRTRANLARTLLQDADVLLLDEPTNHLDIPAVEWLESYLRDLPRAFLIVAHDRYLLDHVTRRTLELSHHHLTSYDAPYSRYLQLRAQRLERQRQEYEAQQEHIARTEEFIRRYGAGQRSKEARGRQKRLDRLERVEQPRDETELKLRLRRPGRVGDVALRAERLVAGYPGRPLVSLPEEVVVHRGEKVALIGPNGSGKTTLLHTLAGTLPPLAGAVTWGAGVNLGYYSQTLADLDQTQSVVDEVRGVRPMSEEEARSYLGRFLFSGDDVFKSISSLSGGEKSRVALAKLILVEPNVLLLDEPTNHLDIASRDALEAVLHDFPGTLLFVSHDRYLIDSLAQQLWVIEDGSLQRYAGGYSEYVSGQAGRLDAAAGHQPRQEAPEAQLDQLEQEAEALAARLAEASATASLQQLTELMDRYQLVQSELEGAQETWLSALAEQIHAFSD